MLVSHNEILLTSRKALESLGWAQGDWEDGAEAIAWLELHGLGGIGRLFNSLSTLQNPYTQQLVQTSPHEFDANNNNCLLVGSWVLDRGYVDASATDNLSRGARITLHNCHDPFFLIPYMLRCALRGIQVSAGWRSPESPGDGWIVHCPANTQQPHISTYRHLHGEILPATSIHLALSYHVSYPFFNTSPDLVDGWRSAQDFAAAATGNLQSGIAVNNNQWQQLKELARGILVPESAESRARGAGE